MKKRGFTLIELLAVILILGIIALIAIPTVSKIIDQSKKGAFENTANNIVNAIEDTCQLQTIKGETITTIYTFTDGAVSPELNIKGRLPKNGNATVDLNCNVAINVTDGKFTATKLSSSDTITIVDGDQVEVPTSYTDYVESEGVNKPKLAPGMTAIKWNGTTEEEVTNPDSDTSWYNYANKEWANAKTADGSYWVWIPRYIYKISTANWHTSTAGTIDVQFSKDTNDNWNSSTIGNINTDTTVNASKNTWANHPAFTFGDKEVTGIWIAKFEATSREGVANNATSDNVTSKHVKIVPAVQSWRYINVSNIFDVCRNMETDNTYGWGTSGNDIDTHLIKNTEWGAVAYLSSSIYGKNGPILVNPNNNFLTGQSGTSNNDYDLSVTYPYNDLTYGVQAGTTGNIYGVYDMSGGATEYTASYVTTTDANLITFGSSLVNANSKYKDVYNTGTNYNDASFFSENLDKIGDAIYETSSGTGSSTSWYTTYSNIPFGYYPFFSRGGLKYSSTDAGIFSFGSSDGYDDNDWGGNYNTQGFRPVLSVSTGL